MMNLEEIEEKYVNTPVSMEQVEKLLTDYLPSLIAEVKRLRDEEMSLISEVKRLRAENAELCKQLELEHDQGEAFIVQIKELIKDRDRLPINIIFDAPPSHDSGRFVEVETDTERELR